MVSICKLGFYFIFEVKKFSSLLSFHSATGPLTTFAAASTPNPASIQPVVICREDLPPQYGIIRDPEQFITDAKRTACLQRTRAVGYDKKLANVSERECTKSQIQPNSFLVERMPK
jgi:hypothetical protein